MSYKKESKYFQLVYTKKDNEYIDELFSYVEKESKNITLFFGLESFEEKVSIKLFDDLNSFRDACSEVKGGAKVPLWLCGLSFRKNGKNHIYSLCLDEYKKTDGHNNCSLENFKQLITHEFVHACHRTYTNIKLPIWLGEGLATFLSHQYDGSELLFNATLEQIIKGGANYINYYTMFSYALNKYGKYYVLKLLNDEKYLEDETKKLYDEVEKIYK